MSFLPSSRENELTISRNMKVHTKDSHGPDLKALPLFQKRKTVEENVEENFS